MRDIMSAQKFFIIGTLLSIGETTSISRRVLIFRPSGGGENIYYFVTLSKEEELDALQQMIKFHSRMRFWSYESSGQKNILKSTALQLASRIIKK